MRLKENRWQRDRMVAGTLCSSVVARMNSRCSGGSSMIFSRALKASRESMWTSSMMYTRFFSTEGGYTASSRRVRASLTLPLEAASSSVTSSRVPASMRAQVVLPVPRVPVNR